ncbi:TetR/AcrR family transcriptional regulator [Halonatronum saccharophilum]|uniref:TetR/AcrR family transcriptional regulator n=1 Tax=Halonatronum saccharophilum TaxID=150060 RepID=UPI0004862A64|nr:TetR/AcrR family transcriptional regulator [Halonatronum saccharophilum]
MPKETFFNLPEEKRRRIIDAAINEFANYSFYKSSINRIVERAQIAKGSFYQYFSGKKDLYKHIIDLVGERKLDYFGDFINNLDSLEFFQLLRELYVRGIKFTKENPKFQAIGENFIKTENEALKREIYGEASKRSDDFFEKILVMGREKGDINPNLDLKLTSFLLTKLNFAISDYLFENIDREGEVSMEDIYDELLPLVDKFIYILENGIGIRDKG